MSSSVLLEVNLKIKKSIQFNSRPGLCWHTETLAFMRVLDLYIPLNIANMCGSFEDSIGFQTSRFSILLPYDFRLEANKYQNP